MITIRKARKQDAQAVWDLRTAAIRCQCKGYYTAEDLAIWTAGTTAEPFAEAVNDTFHVATIDKTVIATGAIDLEADFRLRTGARSLVASTMLIHAVTGYSDPERPHFLFLAADDKNTETVTHVQERVDAIGNRTPTHDADICVYGSTSGGLAAAVQAARMGMRVVLVEPGRHLGGMTSGGNGGVPGHRRRHPGAASRLLRVASEASCRWPGAQMAAGYVNGSAPKQRTEKRLSRKAMGE